MSNSWDKTLQEKSYSFAIQVIELYSYLSVEKKEYILSRRLLKSGTAIGAHIEEGLGMQSDRSFYGALNRAYSEARKTYYWLKLLKDTKYISSEESTIIEKCNELLVLCSS